MQTIKLKLGRRSYNIIVGSNIMKLLPRYINKLNLGSDAYVITNALIKNKHGQRLNKIFKQAGMNARFKTVPDTEKSKSLALAYSVINDIVRFDKKKRIFIVAFGGGVVGDLAGFIASIYKRGIPYIQIPTTLLAQVDSGIGGKTAVDLQQGKNLVGTIYQPRLVFNDVSLLKTLDLRQARSGLAEVIKYGIIKDPQLFVYLERKYRDILSLKLNSLEFIVGRCAFIKAKIVQKDERETRGIRTILNFGHTLGHAIEAAGEYKRYNHAEAIALGMLVACDISRELKFIDNSVAQRIENLIKAIGLPTRIKNMSIEDVLRAHYRDKKFVGSKNKFVLLRDIGKTKIVENLPLKIIREALEKRLG